MVVIMNKLSLWFAGICRDNAARSLLSRSESNGIKGFLIILVLLGHNKYMMEGEYIFRFLYSFHVYSFFLLPFLYDFKPASTAEFVLKNAGRFFVPYMVFFLVLVGIKYFTTNSVSVAGVVVAFITGNQPLIRNALDTGGFLWFIPTMFSLLLIRNVYYSARVATRIVFTAVSLICLACWSFGWLNGVLIYSPLSLFVAFAMLLPALLLRHIESAVSPAVVGLWFFILMVIIFILYPSAASNPNLYLICNRMVCPVIIFAFILSFRRVLAKSAMLINIGKQSFGIYLIHIFLYNGAYLFIDRYVEMNFCFGAVLFAAVLSLSYAISRLKVFTYIVK